MHATCHAHFNRRVLQEFGFHRPVVAKESATLVGLNIQLAAAVTSGVSLLCLSPMSLVGSFVGGSVTLIIR
jgi:hypothetical protein